MNQKHPFEWLSIAAQKRAFLALLILVFVELLGLQKLDEPLKTGVAPAGIVSFELAGKQNLSQQILDSWGPDGRVYAGVSLGLDYLFLVTYASCIGLGCVLVARGFPSRKRFLCLVGVLLAWGQIAAALLDGVENYALIRILLGSELELWPQLALGCALPKFLIVVLGVVYICLGAIAISVAKSRATNEEFPRNS